jgi:hypothetical protein
MNYPNELKKSITSLRHLFKNNCESWEIKFCMLKKCLIRNKSFINRFFLFEE